MQRTEKMLTKPFDCSAGSLTRMACGLDLKKATLKLAALRTKFVPLQICNKLFCDGADMAVPFFTQAIFLLRSVHRIAVKHGSACERAITPVASQSFVGAIIVARSTK